MPKLSPLQVAGPVQGRFAPNVQRSAFGSTAGAQNLAKAGAQLGGIMEKMQIEKDQALGTDTATQTQIGIEAEAAKILMSQGEKALDSAEKMKGLLSKSRQQSSSGLSSKYSKDAFDNSFVPYAARMQTKAIQHQQAETKKYEINTDQAKVDNLNKQMLMTINPQEQGSIQREIYETYNGEGGLFDKLGLSEEKRNLINEQQRVQGISNSIVAQLQAKDVVTARSIFDETKDLLPADTKDKLDGAIKSKEMDVYKIEKGDEAISPKYIGTLQLDQKGDVVNNPKANFEQYKEDVRLQMKEEGYSIGEISSTINYIESRNNDANRMYAINYNQRVSQSAQRYAATKDVSVLDGLESKDKEAIIEAYRKNPEDIDPTAETDANYGTISRVIESMDFNDPQSLTSINEAIANTRLTKKNRDKLRTQMDDKLSGKSKNANVSKAEEIYRQVYGNPFSFSSDASEEDRKAHLKRLDFITGKALQENWADPNKTDTDIMKRVYELNIEHNEAQEGWIEFFGYYSSSSLLDFYLQDRKIDFEDFEFDDVIVSQGMYNGATLNNVTIDTVDAILKSEGRAVTPGNRDNVLAKIVGAKTVVLNKRLKLYAK